jgi:hypothetical protein
MFPGDTKGKRKEDAFLDLPLKKNDHSAIKQIKK